MPNPIPAILVSLTLSLAAQPSTAQDVPKLALAKDLLLPCQDADNDPRDGFISELECLTFIGGFVTAIGVADASVQYCFPDTNRDDEIRRAYVRWVHGSFSKRSKMPVGEALLAALAENFACD